MALHLILGGSGSGKTRYLYEELIRRSMEEELVFFAIVPEQFTMQTQKELVTLHPSHGVSNIDIVSFQRLAYRIFEELAVPRMDVLDDTGKTMVLRKVLAGKQKELQLFEGQMGKPGFVGELKSMLSELYQYGVGPEQLSRMEAEAKSAMLKLKLADLSVIYRGFQEYIKDRSIVAEEILDVLCRRLQDSALIRNSVVTLDGYTGFTPVQYRLVELLLCYCRDVYVTVTLDDRVNPYKKTGMSNLFHMSCETVGKVTDLALIHSVPKAADVVLSAKPAHRFSESPDLDFLESNLYRYQHGSYEREPEQITVYQAVNPRKEVEYVAGQIAALVQRDALRYRDMAVVTGDLASYAHEMERQFAKNQIPCFLDDKKDVMGNPMVELVRAALEIIHKGFTYESMFRYLKTGLIPESREDLDRLENYVLALGIRGLKAWDKEWERTYRGGEALNLETINQVRVRVLEPLKRLKETFGDRKCQVSQVSSGLVGLLAELHIEEQMLEYEKKFAREGAYSLSKEYSQIYGLTMDLLDQIVGLLGEERVSRKEYSDLLDSGFSEMKVGFIPATVDRVVVGDITRTRLDHVKVLFLLGVNDGIIPPSKSSGGVLSDGERRFLKEHRMDLAPTVREDSFMQRFYLYLMMTKPERRLYLTYSAMSAQGKGLRPSSLIGQMRKLFPALRVLEESDLGGEVATLAQGKRKLLEGLRNLGRVEDGPFLELFCWYARDERFQKETFAMARASCSTYEDRGIGRTAAKALYGSVLKGSVTRMEQYAACAYAHFLNYGLELTERKEFELAAVDLGNLFHASLDRFFQGVKESKLNFEDLTEEQRKTWVRESVETVVAQYGNTIMESSSRNAYLAKRVESITDRTVWALLEQLRRGDFVPEEFELAFSAADHLRAMRLSLSEEEELHLRGRIDRLDTCRDGDRLLVKIIDYKSGSTRFDLVDLYYGLQLQLVVYLDAVMQLERRKHPDKTVVPAGLFYYNISNPMVERQPGLEAGGVEHQILRQLRMNGLVNSSLDVISRLDREIETESDVIPVALKNGVIQDSKSSVAGEARFERISHFVGEKLKEEAREILSGRISALPFKRGSRSACDYCSYHGVCGFDLKTEGYRFARQKARKPEDIWKEIEKGGERGVSELDEGTGDRNPLPE